jgi:hypothetical protein
MNFHGKFFTHEIALIFPTPDAQVLKSNEKD